MVQWILNAIAAAGLAVTMYTYNAGDAVPEDAPTTSSQVQTIVPTSF